MDSKRVARFTRFLQYVIGRHPEEFGMVTDAEGFLPVGDVLKVLHGEGWPQVRRHHLESLEFHVGMAVIDIRGHLLRARDRSRLMPLRDATDLPKLLHVPVRRRAYESVLQHGVRPQGHPGQVVLFADPALALRVGQRRDPQPVIVTVNVQAAREQGGIFKQFGETIFLTDQLPSVCCRLPRPPKTVRARDDEQPLPAPAPKTPGSFILTVDPLEDKPLKTRRDGSRGSRDWKKERRKARRWKGNQNKAQ